MFFMFRFKFASSQLGQLTLPDNPRNIDAIDSYFQRSETYYGVNQIMQDISFTWITQGADYIRNIINGYGAGVTVAVTIEYSDNEIDWERFYFGTLELITFKDLFDSVECRLVAGDKESKFLKNIETEYKILLPSTLNISSRENEFTGNFDTVKTAASRTDDLFTSRLYTGSNAGYRAQLFELTKTAGQESKFKNVVSNYDSYVNDATVSDDLLLISAFAPYINEYQNSDIAIQIAQDIQIYGAATQSGAGQVRLLLSAVVVSENLIYKNIYDIATTSYFNPVAYNPAVVAYNRSFSASYVFSAPLAKGDRIILLIRCEHTSISPTNSFSNVNFKLNNQGSLNIYTKEYKDATAHRCISMQRAFNRLAYRQMYGTHPTIDPNIITGDIFTGDFRHTVLTSGTELRQFTGGDGKMTTSFAELFKSLSNPFCLGMGIERVGVSDVVRITVDHRSKYYKPEVVWNLGEVSDLEIEFDEKFIYNALKIDYPSNDNKEAANGIYEFISQYQYTTPCRYVDNELDITSGYRADGASIEEARNNEITETTENQPDDNSNFMIRCRLSGSEYYISNGEEYPSLTYTGVQNTTQLVNLDMYPPLALRFWAWWILAALENESEDIEIQRSEGGAVSFTINSIAYDTNDIAIAKLRQIAQEQPYTDAHGTLFEPYLYNFRAPVTAKFIQAFSANRHGVIEFTYRGITYYGFAMRIPAMPRTDANWILLKLSKRGRSYV